MVLPKKRDFAHFLESHAKIGITAAHGQNIWISLWAPMLKSPQQRPEIPKNARNPNIWKTTWILGLIPFINTPSKK